VVREVPKTESQELNIGQGKQIILTAYAYNIVVIAEFKENLKRTTEKLTDAVKKIGLIINENKTKFMIISTSTKRSNYF